MHGLYVRRMIPKPGDLDREVSVAETFHEQTDDELTHKEVKQMEVDDQAIQTILMGLPEDIYAIVDSCETAQEIWLRVQQMMKGSDIGVQEKKAKLFNEWERFTSTDGESIKSYYHRFSKFMNDFKRNKHFSEKIASNLKFLNNLQPEWRLHVTIVHRTKDSHIADYTQLYDFLKFNQVEMHMVGGNGRNQFGQYAGQMAGNQNGYNAVQNNANQNGNGNVVTARTEGNGNGNNINYLRCYNCKGMGHLARNYTVRPRRMDAAYLQTQLDLDEIEEVNANCILMANLQQASTSDTQTDKAPIYNSDGSAELLEPIPEPQQVQQNDSNVISAVSNMEQHGGTVEQHPATVKETRVYFESLYNNLAIEVEKVNTEIKETNAELTTELARYKNQEKCFEINQEKYDKLERPSHKKRCIFQILPKWPVFQNSISKPISIPDDDFSNDTSPSVARKFLNEVKDTIVTLQSVIKHRMNTNITNWSSSTFQEFHKIIKDEIAPIVNQVDARVQNFENHFVKEAAKFVRDFKSLAKEADESLDKIIIL
ncbi:hypothetical protein Tco_0317872 [Tanacetum coccineum]